MAAVLGAFMPDTAVRWRGVVTGDVARRMGVAAEAKALAGSLERAGAAVLDAEERAARGDDGAARVARQCPRRRNRDHGFLLQLCRLTLLLLRFPDRKQALPRLLSSCCDAEVAGGDIAADIRSLNRKLQVILKEKNRLQLRSFLGDHHATPPVRSALRHHRQSQVTFNAASTQQRHRRLKDRGRHGRARPTPDEGIISRASSRLRDRRHYRARRHRQDDARGQSVRAARGSGAASGRGSWVRVPREYTEAALLSLVVDSFGGDTKWPRELRRAREGAGEAGRGDKDAGEKDASEKVACGVSACDKAGSPARTEGAAGGEAQGSGKEVLGSPAWMVKGLPEDAMKPLYLCYDDLPCHLKPMLPLLLTVSAIPESIANLWSLKFLVLRGCKALHALPKGIEHLRGLRDLDSGWHGDRRCGIQGGISETRKPALARGFSSSTNGEILSQGSLPSLQHSWAAEKVLGRGPDWPVIKDIKEVHGYSTGSNDITYQGPLYLESNVSAEGNLDIKENSEILGMLRCCSFIFRYGYLEIRGLLRLKAIEAGAPRTEDNVPQ
ncbi:hypothetical protein HU200_007520 [Digitaria exilis]|uniref:Uncharacterized protein n=1 Tax=Digitaria exilis TaxID=1010633 RepID=A0A835KSF8_9POAL|nr:hypothetical protein HU200_007520 [Digitaria exilis]